MKNFKLTSLFVVIAQMLLTLFPGSLQILPLPLLLYVCLFVSHHKLLAYIVCF